MCRNEVDDSCLCYPVEQEDHIARLKRYRTELEAEIASVEESIHQIKKEEGKEDVQRE